jgi:hypothetical protein
MLLACMQAVLARHPRAPLSGVMAPLASRSTSVDSTSGALLPSDASHLPSLQRSMPLTRPGSSHTARACYGSAACVETGVQGRRAALHPEMSLQHAHAKDAELLSASAPTHNINKLFDSSDALCCACIEPGGPDAVAAVRTRSRGCGPGGRARPPRPAAW